MTGKNHTLNIISTFKIFGHYATRKTLLIDKARSIKTNGVQVNIKELKIIEQTICSFYENLTEDTEF